MLFITSYEEKKENLILRVSHELRDVRNILQHITFNIEESSSMLLV